MELKQAKCCIITNSTSNAKIFINNFEMEINNLSYVFSFYQSRDKVYFLIVLDDNTNLSQAKLVYINNILNRDFNITWLYFAFSYKLGIENSKFCIIDHIKSKFPEKDLYPTIIGYRQFKRITISSSHKYNKNCSNVYEICNLYSTYSTLDKIALKELIILSSITLSYNYENKIKNKIDLLKKNFGKIKILIKKLESNSKIINKNFYINEFYNKLLKENKYTFSEKIILRNNLLKYNYYELTKIYDKIKKLKSKHDVFYHLKVNGVRNW